MRCGVMVNSKTSKYVQKLKKQVVVLQRNIQPETHVENLWSELGRKMGANPEIPGSQMGYFMLRPIITIQNLNPFVSICGFILQSCSFVVPTFCGPGTSLVQID